VKLELYHYGEKAIKGQKLNWTLVDEAGVAYRKGSCAVRTIQPARVDSLGVVELTLDGINTARKLTLKAELAGVKNEWDIWVYPQPAATVSEGFLYTRSWNEEAKRWLSEGKNVLLVPEKAEGRKARFASHFWNPIMFNWNPMIVGTLIRNQHPAFGQFPTREYADWQWFDVLNGSTALELNNLKEITPIIQSIDSYETNQKLGIAFEAKVGNGNLFVLCIDPEKNIDKRLAAQQLLVSVKQYVASAAFLPEKSLQLYEVDALFPAVVQQKSDTGKTNQAIQQLLNK
ncbi:MAG: beta-galactosidase, partial [Bacteroides sp.]